MKLKFTKKLHLLVSQITMFLKINYIAVKKALRLVKTYGIQLRLWPFFSRKQMEWIQVRKRSASLID
jgi:hypothetical protein